VKQLQKKIENIAEAKRLQLFKQWQSSVDAVERERLFYQVEALNSITRQLLDDIKKTDG